MVERNYVRVKSDFLVWYQTVDEDDISFGKPASKNVSAGGILLEMEEEERVGSLLKMKFKIPDHDKDILADGKVAWVKRIAIGIYEIGIEFTKITEEDMAAISRLVNT